MKMTLLPRAPRAGPIVPSPSPAAGREARQATNSRRILWWFDAVESDVAGRGDRPGTPCWTGEEEDDVR